MTTNTERNNSIGSPFEKDDERVVHVHDSNDAVWVTEHGRDNVIFCFEDSVEGTVRSVTMSRDQWKHLASLPITTSN